MTFDQIEILKREEERKKLQEEKQEELLKEKKLFEEARNKMVNAFFHLGIVK